MHKKLFATTLLALSITGLSLGGGKHTLLGFDYDKNVAIYFAEEKDRFKGENRKNGTLFKHNAYTEEQTSISRLPKCPTALTGVTNSRILLKILNQCLIIFNTKRPDRSYNYAVKDTKIDINNPVINNNQFWFTRQEGLFCSDVANSCKKKNYEALYKLNNSSLCSKISKISAHNDDGIIAENITKKKTNYIHAALRNKKIEILQQFTRSPQLNSSLYFDFKASYAISGAMNKPTYLKKTQNQLTRFVKTECPQNSTVIMSANANKLLLFERFEPSNKNKTQYSCWIYNHNLSLEETIYIEDRLPIGLSKNEAGNSEIILFDPKELKLEFEEI
jgi:hypothetical protein